MSRHRPRISWCCVVLGGTWLDPADLRQAAIINQELYGFYGISAWVTSTSHPRELLESTKLIKFERCAEFTVADLAGRGLALWATGQRPHYDVVYEGNDLESLVARLAGAPHRIRDDPSVDREEQPVTERDVVPRGRALTEPPVYCS
jgi:hypothetical protein